MPEDESFYIFNRVNEASYLFLLRMSCIFSLCNVLDECIVKQTVVSKEP